MVGLAILIFFCPVLFPHGWVRGGEAWSYTKTLKHSRSWDAVKSQKKWEHRHIYKRSDRRVSVSKIGTVRLKKSSFFNFRPFQFSTPVIADSMLYIGVDAGVFYGIDALKTKKKWTYRTQGPVQAPAGVDGDAVYFGDAKGNVYALETSSGKEIWKTSLDSPILAAPLIRGDRIYFVTDNGRLFAIDKNAGGEIWHTDSVEKAIGFSVKRASSPVFTNGLIMFGTSTGTLLAYRENGTLAWVKQLGDRQALISDLDSRPIIEGGRIYVATADRKVFCIDQNNGNIIWSTSDAGGSNDLFLSEDKLYATGGGVLTSIEASSGNIIWEEDFETPEISSPAVSKDIVAVVSTRDKVYLVDDKTGDIIFERYVRRGSFGDPVFVNNRLYLISNTGRIFSFLVREKQLKKS